MMRLLNTQAAYGLVSIKLHWLIALLVIGLFICGVWMVTLGYYHPWYNRAPWWHKGLGVLVFVLILLRWVWQLLSASPAAIPSTPVWQRRTSKFVHSLMNGLIFLICVSGYLMVTAKGQALEIFDVIKLPALLSLTPSQAEWVGDSHRWLAYSLIMLVFLHVMAAFKHHFINNDQTLKRMLGR